MTPSCDDLRKLREICLNLSVGSGIQFFLHIIPTDGVKWEDFPGFEQAIPSWIKDQKRTSWQDGVRIIWGRSKNWGKNIKNCLWLLPSLHRRTTPKSNPSRFEPYIQTPYDILKTCLVHFSSEIGTSNYCVLLRTPSIEESDHKNLEGLLDGEKNYLEFVEQAGLTLLANGIVTADKNVEGWMSFLVQYLIEKKTLDFRRGFATVKNLQVISVQAIDSWLQKHTQEIPTEITQKKAGRPKNKNSSVFNKVIQLKDEGKKTKDIAEATGLKLDTVKRYIDCHRKRNKRAQKSNRSSDK